ncbi:hypothetical protein C1646_749560 [Rhizophagus diaphanus]|nr:hypothetical protein C1646_749560 [Rhizophagus diaphanus] [Rhizophagus sp. MUCL 43196]
MAIVHDEILNRVEHGCKVEPPNIVILKPGGVPNSDEDVVADEAIFRRIIKLTDQWPYLRPIIGQWHTSKDMCSILIVLFSSYGIFDLANSLGVKFLEKLESVVDYRSTVPAKTRYASSVCHFLGILEKFPKLEDKLRYAASIKIDNNEK